MLGTEKLKAMIGDAMTMAIEQEAARLLEQAKQMRTIMTYDVVEDDTVYVEGSITPIIDDPAHLLENHHAVF